MCHPLSTFTICIFRPLYFLHLNFVRSYCSWPPFHPLPFLNFHFIHEFQHELEATLSYQKTTMKSILKVLLHEQPLNLLISCFSDMTQLQHPFKCSMKLQINSKLPKKWTKLFSSKYSLSGGLNRINLLLQFLLMWLGLPCFPAWICIPWNFIKASATLKSKWKDLAFSNPQSTNYAAYNSSLHNSWWLRLGPPTKNKWYDLIIPWQIKALYKREYEPCSRHLANWPGKFLLWWLKDVKSCHQEQDETCQPKMDWIHLWA